MAEPIKDTSGGLGAILQLLGTQGSTNTSGQTLAQQIQNALTQGSTTGSTSGTSTATTTNTAELAPLIQAFSQASQGMSPEMLTQLISSIFTEGAAKIPALTQQYANATGSRVSGNSGLQLALSDLNRDMSTQAVQALLGYNQQQAATAAQTAAQIAANTRQTNQTGQQQQQTAGTTQQSQQQTGSTNTTQQQQQGTKSGVNPNMAALLGAGGTALNFLDKKGVFDSIFGRNTGTGGIGTGITSSAGLAPTLTNGGGAGTLATPAASQGFLQGPLASSNPYSYSPVQPAAAAPSGGSIPSVSAPSFSPSGITGLGGFGSTPSGGIGLPGNVGFGSLPTGFDAFGTAGTGSLGSNLDFGSNPYGYGGTAGGITDVVNGSGSNMMGGFTGGFNDLMGGLGSTLGGFGDSLGSLFGGAADWIGSFFANGGMIGPQPRLAYADGGQVETGGAPQRTRNVNYLGPRQQRERSEALNYEGYSTAAPVGSSQPAGGSPSLGGGQAALIASAPVAPGFTATSSGNSNQQALDLFRQSVARAQAQSDAAAAARAGAGGAGGSGGVGEGGAPTGNEADAGAAGIGPSGIAAAPQGTAQGISTGLGMVGMPAPGLSAMLGFIAAMAAAVNAANQPNQQAMMSSQDSAVTGGSGDAASGIGAPANVDSPDIGVTVSVPGLSGISSNMGGAGGGDGGGVGASGGPGSGSDGGPGDSGVGGDSAGDGTSGSAGTSAGGDAWKNGGLVRGPGTGTSDSVRVKSRDAGGKDIHYSDGEYVIPADVVQALGAQHFDSILEAFHTRV